jgi:hypothetical protein
MDVSLSHSFLTFATYLTLLFQKKFGILQKKIVFERVMAS